MSEPCAHERGDEIKSFVAAIRALTAMTAERDSALAALVGVGQVLFDHPHADTCAIELSPNEGYECSCWRSALWAVVGVTP